MVAQSTGFEHRLPTGAGLLSFETIEEAVEAIAEVRSNVAKHSRAAREIAEEYLDDRKVVGQLLDAAWSDG